MKNAYPIVCVLYEHEENELFKCFETFSEAEEFMDYVENIGGTVTSLEKV